MYLGMGDGAGIARDHLGFGVLVYCGMALRDKQLGSFSFGDPE